MSTSPSIKGISSMNDNIVIGLAGDSGAGKTSLLKFFSNYWKDDILLIEGDAYHKWERNDEHWKSCTPLNPAANNLAKCANDLKSLKENKLIQLSDYNHSTGKFDEPRVITPKRRIILAGLHALYTQKLRQIEDIKIYLNTDEDLRLFWKYKRDIQERGYSKEDVSKAIARRLKDSKLYIRPQIHYADIIINIIDENLDFSDFNYIPKISMNLLVDKKLPYIKEILHILKNINFKVKEDERYIKAVYDEKFEQIQSLSV